FAKADHRHAARSRPQASCTKALDPLRLPPPPPPSRPASQSCSVGRSFLRGLQHRIEGGLGSRIAVEQQRITRSPLDRPIVEPRIPVRHAPEGHARDDITVLQKNTEQAGIPLCQGLLDGVWKTG